MRVKDYERLGIHSRLNCIIKKSGGFNSIDCTRALIRDYAPLDYDIAREMARDPSIWTSIRENGIEIEKSKAKVSITEKRRKFNALLGQFSSLKSTGGI